MFAFVRDMYFIVQIFIPLVIDCMLRTMLIYWSPPCLSIAVSRGGLLPQAGLPRNPGDEGTTMLGHAYLANHKDESSIIN